MNEYIARYVVSKDHRIIGVINTRYTANNDDESIKIAKSVCDKLGEGYIEELTIEKTIGTINIAVAEKSVDSTITKIIYSKKYPCIKPRPFEEIANHVDLERLEEIANER
ncbi:MAG: hypothetical protein OWQ50_05105 [Acidianus infernus]|nr:hypothetical protein [Acidianus infernus]